MSDFVFADGTPIPDDQVGEAIKSGKANVVPGTKLRMFGKNGAPMLVPAENFGGALADGWQYESPAQYEQRKYNENFGLVEGAKAIGEGLARGTTSGFSDAALSALTDEQGRKNIALRKESLPGKIAEAVGVVAPALLSGGTETAAARGLAEASNVAKAGEVAAEAGTAIKEAGVASKALTAAREAAAYTPAAAISRAGLATEQGVKAALERAGLGADSFTARALSKGLSMGSAGAVEGGLYGAGQGVSEAALAPDGNYDKLAEHVITSAKDGALFGAILGGGLGAGSEALSTGSKAIANKVMGDKTVQGLIDDIGNQSAEHSLHATAKNQRELQSMKGEAGKILQSEGVIAGDAETTFANAVKLKADAGKQLGDLLDKVGDVKVDTQAFLTDVQKIRDTMGKGMLGGTKQALANFDAQMEPIYTKLANKDEFGKFKPSGVTIADLHQAKMEVGDLVKDFTQQGNSPMKKAMQKLYGTLRSKIEETGVAAEGPAWGEAYNAQNARFQVGAIAEKSLAKHLERLGSNRVPSITDTMWGGAALAGGLATGHVGAAALMTAAATSANNYLRKNGMSVVARIARSMRETEATTASKMRKFIRAPDLLPAAVGPGREAFSGRNYGEHVESYNRLLTQLSRANQAPPQLRVVDAGAPRTGFVAQQLQKRIIQNVINRAPSKPPAVPSMVISRGLGYRRPTPSELSKFSRYVATVNDPSVALKALESGRLTRDHVEALKENYPNRYDQLRKAAMTEIAGAPEPPSYHKLIKLGLLLDIPLVPTLRADHIKISQSVYSPEEQNGTSPDQQPEAPSRPIKLNTKKYSTRVERIEAGEMDSI